MSPFHIKCGYAMILLMAFACQSQPAQRASTPPADNGQVSQEMTSGRPSGPDSVFRMQVDAFEPFEITAEEWKAIMALDERNWLPIDMAKHLFQREAVDWRGTYHRFQREDSIWAERFDLGVDSEAQRQVLVILGPTDGNSLENNFVLIKGNSQIARVIEQFYNFHHRHTEKFSFTNPSDKTTFSYQENHGYGGGFWYFSWHFYTIDGLKVFPSLRFLSSSNVATGSGYRFYRYDAEIEALTPMKVSVAVSNELLPEDAIVPRYPFASDTATIRFEWLPETRRYVPQFPPNLSARKLAAYEKHDPAIFLDAYQAELDRRYARGNDTVRGLVERVRQAGD